MGINFLLPIIAGIVMTIMVGTQFAPSIVDGVKSKKVEYTTINNQDMIFEATKRYITLMQTNPTKIEDLIENGFLKEEHNDNGFGKGYEIKIDDERGTLTLTTEIKDKKAQDIFLKSFNNKVPPKQVDDTDDFTTTYVIPTSLMHGSGLFLSGIPTQNSAPDASKYKYWYDTSGDSEDKVVLKMSNGTNWKEVRLLSQTPIGGIIMWSGSIEDIPDGWVLCNGDNGTPDLTNKFIIGSSYDDASGQSVTTITGANTKTGGIKDAIVVAHTHTQDAHAHSGSTNWTGNHNHGWTGLYGTGYPRDSEDTITPGGFRSFPRQSQVANAGGHSHNFTTNYVAPAIHSTGQDGTNANLPPYYALAFIMKI